MGTDTTSTRGSMWFAFLAGPVTWSLHETVTYALARSACSNGLLFVEYLLTLLALGVVGFGLLVALRLRRTASDGSSTLRFVAMTAVAVNAVFAFAIVMETIPMTVISPCL